MKTFLFSRSSDVALFVIRSFSTATTTLLILSSTFQYQNSKYNDKWNKVKQKLSKKERNNNYILNIIIKEKLLGYVRLLRYSYGEKV